LYCYKRSIWEKNEKEIYYNGKTKLSELKFIDDGDGDGGCCLMARQRLPKEEQNYEKFVFIFCYFLFFKCNI
jgi:hypothetical protein